MDQEKLDSLINRLESYERRHPAAYRLRVGLLAALGYAYLLAVVLCLLTLVVLLLFYGSLNFIVIKIIWIPLVVVGLVLRSLWITIPEPDGQEVASPEAPKLFAVVEEVRQSIKGPQVHHLLLSDSFNAGIVQVPRFGMFGWSSNYLVIGLPLLKGLSPEEFRSVLAHEFGHLSGKHGRFSGWIYRVRQSWIEVLTRVHQERHYASFVFEPFLKWYAPFFNAYSFVLARAQEYEADGYAVEVSGREVTARMLVRLSTAERIMTDEFWPAFYRPTTHEANPPKDPFAQLLAAMDTKVEPPKTTKWVLQALKTKTGNEDTHPALPDRLIGIGFKSEELETLTLGEVLTPGEINETAANYYLSELPNDLVVRSDRLWRERIAPTWRERHGEVLRELKRLKELEFGSRARTLTIDELWEQANLVESTQDPAAALPLIQNILALNPDHAGANLALGTALLKQNDRSGLTYLEKAMQLDDATTLGACNTAADFLMEHGALREAERYQERAQDYGVNLQKFYDQAFNFSTTDRFAEHGLSEAEVEKLRTQLDGMRGLGRTYLVRKIIDDVAEPLYVIGALATFTWRAGENEKHPAALIESLASRVQFLPNTVFVSLDRYPFLISKFEKVPGSVVLIGGDEMVELRH